MNPSLLINTKGSIVIVVLLEVEEKVAYAGED